MRIDRPQRPLAAFIAAVLALAACGGDDGADASGADTAPAATAASEATTSAAPATTAAATPEEVTVKTFYGEELTVPFSPETLVVLDYAALDSLDHLGLGDRVVGIPTGTPPPPHLADYAEQAENVGDLFEADLEAINKLDPDLIIAGGRSQKLVPELQEIAPTLDLTFEWGSVTFLESLTANTNALGEVFGLEDEVTTELSDLEARAASVADQAADEGKGLVVLTSGGEVSAYGPDPAGRFDLVYNVFGVAPVAEQIAIDTHGDTISFEFLAQTNPDLLIVLDRDAAIGEAGQSARELLDNDLVNGTNAAKNGKIVYVDTAKWYLAFGGLSSYGTMIDEVDSIVD